MRILIVDEEAERGQALEARLEGATDMLVTGCVTSMAEAAEAAVHNDVVLVQCAANGRKLVRVLVTSYPHLKVLVVGVAGDDWEEILPYLEVGAAGYVTARELAPDGEKAEMLWEKVRAAHRDEAIISPQMAAMIMRRIAEIAEGNGQGRTPVSLAFASALLGYSTDQSPRN